MARLTQSDRTILRAIRVVEGTPSVHTATAFLSPTLTVRVTRQGKPRKRARQATYLVSVGAPNYRARRQLKRLQGEGASFPLTNLMVDSYAAAGAGKAKKR